MSNITEKQKCIAEQAVYGDLKAIDFGDTYTKPQTLAGYQGRLLYLGCTLNNVTKTKPVLRPLSDLTKEITHNGYNDDQPFIPLVELAKTTQEVNTAAHFELQGDMVVDFMIAYHFKHNVMWFQSLQRDKRAYILPNQHKYFDLLHLWHFDTRNLIDAGEAIDVNTLDINPYSVN